MQPKGTKCLTGVLGLALLLSCRLHAQRPVERFFRDELGLSFIVLPPSKSSFGVGSIVTGRGRQLDVWFFASNSLPERERLKQDGVIKRDPFRKDLGILRTTHAFLRLSGLSALIGRARYLRLTLEEPEMEEVDRATAERFFQSDLTEAARERMRKDPRLELVYRALHCKSLRFLLLDGKMADVQLPTPGADASFRVESDGVTGVLQNGWIAFRSLRYDVQTRTLRGPAFAWPDPRKRPPLPPVSGQQITVVTAKDKDPVIGFERVAIHPE